MPTHCKSVLSTATLFLASSALPLSWGSLAQGDDTPQSKVVIRLSLAPSSKDSAAKSTTSEPISSDRTEARETTDALTSKQNHDASQTPRPHVNNIEARGLTRKPGIPIFWQDSPIVVAQCVFDQETAGSSRKRYSQAPDPISLMASNDELKLKPSAEEVASDLADETVPLELIVDSEDDLTELTLDGIVSVSPIAQPAAKPTGSAAGEASSQGTATNESTAENILRSPTPQTAKRTDEIPAKIGSRPVKSLIESNAPAKLPSGNRLQESERSQRPPAPAKQLALDNELALEANEECPGSPDADLAAQTPQLDDLPLEQDEHPYDAPAAKSSKGGNSRRTLTDISTEDERLRDRINAVLLHFLTHPENVSRRGPWALMHAALPFGVEAEVIAGNRSVNALGWMCYNGVCAKQRMFQPTKQGFRTNVGPGVQGHEGQFLAILAQSSVQSDYPIVIGSRRYTIMDLAKYEMATCREKTELTFKLIGLSHYLEPNQQWRDNRGRAWSLEKLVAEELAQPIIGQACGGTHRLMGLSYSLIKRQQAGLPITGHWKRSEVFLNDFVNYAMSLQNADGSFSTEWFEGRGDAADIERKIQTTGHILEWLVYTLPDEHLRSLRIQKSIEFLVNTLGKEPNRDWPIGPRGHALRALALYNQRVHGAEAGNMRAFVATSPNATAIKR